MIVRKYRESDDIFEMVSIWNEIVKSGKSFPQENELKIEEGKRFFSSQDYCGVALIENKIVGLYILHPNNVGRCSHICNASYAVKEICRGLGAGEALVKDCILQAKRLDYRVLQFNAVVSTNLIARALYEKLGFKQLGVIPGGFKLDNGEYEDICPYYLNLVEE